ncbi:MAG: cellulose biosynthesis protein BcsQ [Pusillimonas sp.]
MNVLSIVSAKGGVGKSTVAANLAVALYELGHPVLAIDLDPQNGLRFHFSFEVGAGRGLAHSDGSAASLADLVEATPSGVALIPYGLCDEAQRQAFEDRLAHNPSWLVRALKGLGLPGNTVIVLDTPPGPSVYMTQALTAASLALAVTLPDAGSYVTLPQLRALFESYSLGRPDFRDYGIVVNQVDQGRQLGRDVMAMLRASFGEHIIGRIHQDQAMSEALAYGQNVFQYAPHSEGAQDIMACANWVSSLLGISGGGTG